MIKTYKKKTISQVGVQKLGVPVFFYNSCRTWFIEMIEEEGKGKPSGFYWQVQNRHLIHALVRITFM